jgi:hypothetical protein
MGGMRWNVVVLLFCSPLACGGSSGAGGNGGGSSSGSSGSGSGASSGSNADASGEPDSAVGTDATSGTSSSGSASSSGSSGGSSSAATSSSGSVGDSGAGSSSDGGVSLCNFASGLNVPWVNFANDVPNPDLATFKTIFQNTYAAGGRVVRWWFHTNGTVTPGYDSSGMASPLAQSHIDGIKSILSAAHAAGVAVNISLWSFDMLQGTEGITAGLRTNNQNLLTVDANRQAYIDRYLTPLVTALKGTPGLYSYEIFNEPEGMSQYGWTTGTGGSQVDESYVQKTVNWFAAAIHTADPTALVTNGAVTFHYCSTISGNTNYYSDTALKNAGGKTNGTLDFYEVHYYASNGTAVSCFLHPASYWALDKKLVMGEFFAQATDGVAQANLYTYLYSNGYSGAWAWAYNSDVKWPAMQVPMQDLIAAHSDVGSCP